MLLNESNLIFATIVAIVAAWVAYKVLDYLFQAIIIGILVALLIFILNWLGYGVPATWIDYLFSLPSRAYESFKSFLGIILTSTS